MLLPFFRPSMATLVYHGSCRWLDGATMSQAYRSVLDISFDERGGLLIRQVHHWSADVFVAAICLRLLRAFFRGRFSGRALPGWLIWVVLLPLGMLAADWFNDIIEHRQFVQLGLIPSEFSGSHSKPSTPKSTTRPTGSPSAASGKAQPRKHRRTKRYRDDGRAILAVTERVRRSVHHERSPERPAQPSC